MNKFVLMMAVLMGVVAFAAPEKAAAQKKEQAPAKETAQKKDQTSAQKEKKATMTLTEARNKIGDVIEGKADVAKIMQSLSTADQKTFLGEVNQAIAKLPASPEEKAAKALSVDMAALKSAKGSDNMVELVAEVFGAASVDSLPILSEQFADNLFNRAADPSVTYSDAQYTKIAQNTMKSVNERVAETDCASVRSTFAILMFARASNGTPTDLTETLIETLPSKDAQEMARNEWIPAAQSSEGKEANYEPLLMSADAGRRPDTDAVLVVAGPQQMDALLLDLSGKDVDLVSTVGARAPVVDAIENPLIHQIPTLGGELNEAPPSVDDAKPYAGQY